MNYIIAFDVEGPIASPDFDFTWLCLEHTSKQFYEKIKLFDEYDDLRWMRERDKRGRKHSTGTTPLVSLLAAACEGFGDIQLKEIAREKLKLSNGASELLKWLIRERGIMPYLITSSYPAVSLILGRKFNIPSSHIYCAGNQLSRAELFKFDRNPNFELELKRRSPMELWSRKQTEVARFLSEYLENCIELRNCYIQGKNHSHIQEYRALLRKQRKIYQGVKDDELRTSLIELILKQRGVMGGHNKKRVLEKLSPNPRYAIYIGDGIVDADCLEYASFGIAINCVNRFALLSCKFNIATGNEANLIPILEEILDGRFNLEKIHSSDELTIFPPSTIRANFEEVRRVNSYYRALL
ncbi:MAG: hypothetical protein QXJ68_01835 [Methanocellales archaeon]